MQGKYILFALVVILLFVVPGSASLNLISPRSTVFIGESNLDMSKAFNGCNNISWWANGTTSTAPAKTIIINNFDEVSPAIFHYTVDPATYSGYTGTWYCTSMEPPLPIFQVADPQIEIRVWDLDHNQDVTGQTVPITTNVTYRIDTNLDAALNYSNRRNGNPTDSFYTVTLTDPSGRTVSTIFTGSAGNPQTIILNFDMTPFITSSPYYWQDGAKWNRAARNKQGDIIYPAGTYTFTVSQNLNGMQAVYAANMITALDGKTTSSANVTFTAPASLVTTQATQLAATTALPDPDSHD